MLSLTRKAGQYILIGDDIVIHTVWIKGHQVRIGIEAPDHVDIVRGEIASPNASSFLAPKSSQRYPK
jgi:carbon storage regulator